MDNEKIELQVLPTEGKEPLTSYLNLEMTRIGEDLNLEFYAKLVNLLADYKYELSSLRVSTNRW